MAQAELHFLRAPLQDGKLNEAKEGELNFPLPVGLTYDRQGQIVLDPNEEVRGAVQLAFGIFRETGSAYKVVHWFSAHGLNFPKRAYGGAWNGRLIWGPLTHGRVLGLIKNPSYDGPQRSQADAAAAYQGYQNRELAKNTYDCAPYPLAGRRRYVYNRQSLPSGCRADTLPHTIGGADQNIGPDALR